MYRVFISCVQANLHVVLSMSPVGEAFRQEVKRYFLHKDTFCIDILETECCEVGQAAVPHVPVAHQLLHDRLVSAMATPGASGRGGPVPLGRA